MFTSPHFLLSAKYSSGNQWQKILLQREVTFPLWFTFSANLVYLQFFILVFKCFLLSQEMPNSCCKMLSKVNDLAEN